MTFERTFRAACEAVCVDTHRRDDRANESFIGKDRISCVNLVAQDLTDSFQEVTAVRMRLKAHDIVGTEVTQQLVALRQCGEYAGGHERDVQKKPDAVPDAHFPQRSGKWNQVIVVNPDEIVFAQKLDKSIREYLVHSAI